MVSILVSHCATMRAYQPIQNSEDFLRVHQLFGNEKGAFTGATQVRLGKFEAADGGTLFLDEVGGLSLDNQIKLLRVLEEKCFYRLGGNKTIQVDVRIVAATNKDLQKAIEAKAFREDLYYRLNVAAIYIPPLRERRADIIPLAEQFLQEFCGTFARSTPRIHPEAEERLLTYEWKGNVQELSEIPSNELSSSKRETPSCASTSISSDPLKRRGTYPPTNFTTPAPSHYRRRALCSMMSTRI